MHVLSPCWASAAGTPRHDIFVRLVSPFEVHWFEVQTARLLENPTQDGVAYYQAVCHCGWAGQEWDIDDPRGEENAFGQARGHGPNVAAEVVT